MKIHSRLTPLLLIIFFLMFVTSTLCSTKLLYMANVFRHGARYPINNMYDGKQTAEFHGNLTSVGLRQHYLLGNYVRNDYINNQTVALLNSTLKPRQVQVFTLTDQTRCIESAYAHTLGLFPFYFGEKIDFSIDPKLLQPPFQTIFPSNLISQSAPSADQNFALDHGFQPVPIRFGDKFFPKCPKEAQIFAKRGQKIVKQVTQLQTQYTLFTQKMSKLFGVPLAESNLAGMVALYDTLAADVYLGRKMPSSFTDADFDTLMFFHRYMFVLVFEEQPSQILNAPFVNSMLSNMEKAIKGQLDIKKLTIVSGHDINVVPLMAFFNLTSADCLKRLWNNQTVTGNCAIPIPFASNIFFELHQDTKLAEQYFVEVRYNGKYFNLCGKNSTQCAFSEFAQKARNHLLDFNKQCGVKSQKPQSNQQLQQILKQQ